MNKEKLYQKLGRTTDFLQVGGSTYGIFLATALLSKTSNNSPDIGAQLIGIFLASHCIVGITTAVNRINGNEIE